ncbi:hypothetical protein HMPREF9120_00935 [Neisseria sp. oral taxon 020 str. F0370]|nr:hypothetical protein HMPREF9120_00935 [Neisseria sp. oral taxon 020 str. F0370]
MQNGGIFGGILVTDDFLTFKNQLIMNIILVSPSTRFFTSNAI